MTAVERKTRFTMIALAANKTAEAVKDAILGALSPLAAQVERLTYDNGKEFALHEVIAEQLNAQAYFAHPLLLCLGVDNEKSCSLSILSLG